MQQLNKLIKPVSNYCRSPLGISGALCRAESGPKGSPGQQGGARGDQLFVMYGLILTELNRRTYVAICRAEGHNLDIVGNFQKTAVYNL